MLQFRVRWFLAILGFAAFTLIFISVGIRWHTYRARASFYAKQEVENTFEAAHYARAALAASSSEDDQDRGAYYRSKANQYARAARECTQLREFYESCW